MSLEPSNKKFRRCPKTLEVPRVCVKNQTEIKEGNSETDRSCLELKHGSTTGIVDISEEVEHNLYCEIMQQFVQKFDSMNYTHPIHKLVNLIQRFKTFITAKKKVTGKDIIFQPSVRILCLGQTSFDDCALCALKNCEWFINNMTNEISVQNISCSLPEYNDKDALKDRV